MEQGKQSLNDALEQGNGEHVQEMLDELGQSVTDCAHSVGGIKKIVPRMHGIWNTIAMLEALQSPNHQPHKPKPHQALNWRCSHPRFRVQGSGFRVEGFGFRV